MHPRASMFAAAGGAALLLASLMFPASGAEQLPRNSIASTAPQTDGASSGDGSEMPVATTLYETKGVLGSAVRSATDEDMGRIIDVVVDSAGTPRAAVIDFGGFLGVGSRKIAIGWNAIRFAGVDGIRLDLTRDQVKDAPLYEDGKPVVILGRAAEYTRSRMTER
jgi:hypothetical protein